MKKLILGLIIAVLVCVGIGVPAYATAARTIQTPHVTALHVDTLPCRSTSTLDMQRAYEAPTIIQASLVRVAADTATPVDSLATSPRPSGKNALLLTLMLGAALGITANKVSSDKNTYPSYDTVRQQHNLLVADLLYAKRNYIVGTSTPACATGSGNVKPKTTNAVNYVRGGVPRAQLAGADNFWDLTTANQGATVVPASSFIKYWLCVTAAEAQKVYSSVVAATAAAATFPSGPADGDTILGVLTVATDGTHTFTPGTTSLGAAGITATYVDGSDGSEIMANQVTP